MTYTKGSVFASIVVALTIIIVMWQAVAQNESITTEVNPIGDQSQTQTQTETTSLAAGENVPAAPGSNPNAIIQNQQNVLNKTCQCPMSDTMVVQGRIGGEVLIGEKQGPGNTPYNVASCASNARDTLRMLQNQDTFMWTQALTRNKLTQFPPSKLFYSWDQKTKYCAMFFECQYMVNCSDTNHASGVVSFTGDA